MRSRENRERVERYYTATLRDYAQVWYGEEDNALHLGHYDRAREHHDSLRRTNELVASLASFSIDSTVLDAGCGIGGSSVWLARTYGCRVIAANIVFDQLFQTKANAAKAKVTSSVQPICQDFHALGFVDNAFDVVWAIESCVHARSLSALFAEFFRVVRRSGYVVLADFTLADDLRATTRIAQRLATLRRGWALSSLVKTSTLQARMRHAGLVPMDVRDNTALVTPSITRLGQLARAAAPTIREWRPVDTSSSVRAANIEAAMAVDNLVREGIVRYSLIAARKA